jgi:hypothetical protein
MNGAVSISAALGKNVRNVLFKAAKEINYVK